MRSSALVALAVFVAGMALFTEQHAFPFYYHKDEPGKVVQVLHRKKNFNHPTLMLTAAELARGVWLHGAAARDPQRVIEVSRVVVATFAAAGAALLALLAARLLGVWAGLSAGLLLVTQPLLYELAHYFKEDPVFVFGIAASAWAAHHHAARRDRRSLLLLGAAAGVAAAGKYIGAALVPIAAAIGAGMGGGAARERWRRAGAVVASALAVWLVLNFRLFGTPPATLPHSVHDELGRASITHHGLLDRLTRSYYFGVQYSYGGWWTPALAALWLAYALYRPRRVGIAEWLLAGVSALLLLALLLTPRLATRYYLPIAVALCFLAAAGVFRWAALAGSRSQRARIAAAAVAVLLCAAGAARQWRDTRELRIAFHQDDPAQLREAVAALPPSTFVVQDEEAGLPEPERRWEQRGLEPLRQRVLGAQFAADVGTIAELRARGVTHLALCQKRYGHFLSREPAGGARDLERSAFYRTAFERGRVLREWKPGRLRYLQPGLALIDISGIDPGAEE